MTRCRAVATAFVALLTLAPAASAQDAQPIACKPTATGERLAARASRYDSTAVKLGDATALICYSRPALKGRKMIGGEAVPYGKLWRTGANEPTIIHLPVAATIAGIAVEPGSYSIYTIPNAGEWTVIVNRSTSQWGHESRYVEAVQKQEVGRAEVKAATLDAPVELFTIASTPRGAGRADVTLEWDRARIVIPVALKR